jgi:menaquinone-dependent protoporphyrinogen oxidase
MLNKIFVAYASQVDSPAGVAEAIGQALVKSGVMVEVRPTQVVKDLAPYQAVVIVSTIQGGQWLPGAIQFMQIHQAALAQKPFAAFLMCMPLAMANTTKYRQDVVGWLEPVCTRERPVSEGFFAGTLNISPAPSFGDRLRFRLSIALGAWTEGDYQDWQAIHAWVESIRPLLLREPQSSLSSE